MHLWQFSIMSCSLFSLSGLDQVIVIFNLIRVEKVDYHDTVLPDWAQAVGWMTALIPLFLVPVAAIYTYIKDCRNNSYSAETVWQVCADYKQSIICGKAPSNK